MLLEGLDYRLNLLLFGSIIEPARTSQNPGNQFLRIWRYAAEFHFRFDLSIEIGGLRMSAKPRAIFRGFWLDEARHREEEIFLNEWILQWRIFDSLVVSYGSENIQWGPSYLASPSNPFFSDNGKGHPKLEVRGKDILRLVYIPSRSWSISWIFNPREGPDIPSSTPIRRKWRSSKDFEPLHALKVDYAGFSYNISALISSRGKARPFFGAYGTWTLSEALLLYFEGRIGFETEGLYPVPAPGPFGAFLAAARKDSGGPVGTLLVGASYSLEAGPTLTFEYLYYGPGYGQEESGLFFRMRKRAAMLLFDPKEAAGAAAILGGTADPGLVFLRKNYMMAQLLHTGLIEGLDITLRWIQNLDDLSARFLYHGEYALGDNLQLFCTAVVNIGDGSTEFDTFFGYSVMAGLQYSF